MSVQDAFNVPDWDKCQLSDASFWPPETEKKFEAYQSELDKFIVSMGPVVRFLETAAFAMPAAGVFVSATIGLAYTYLKPTVAREHQIAFSTILAQVVEDQLSMSELVSARRKLNEFADHFHTALSKRVPETRDESEECQAMALQFENYCSAGGLLHDAFHTIKDNLSWFDTSVHELLVTSMLTYIVSERLRMLMWQKLVIYYQKTGNINGYNNAQYQVMRVYTDVPPVVQRMFQGVETRIQEMKASRLRQVIHKLDGEAEPNHFRDHRKHEARYHTQAYVLDQVSKQKLLYITMKDVGNWSQIQDFGNAFHNPWKFIGIDTTPFADFRPDGSKDDAWLEETIKKGVEVYKKRLLPPQMGKPFKILLDRCRTKVLDGANALKIAAEPVKDIKCPQLLTRQEPRPAPKEFLDHFVQDDDVTFCFDIIYKGNALRSAYSEKLNYDGESLIPCLLINDGLGAARTRRNVYARRGDGAEFLVGTVEGYGLRIWPEAK